MEPVACLERKLTFKSDFVDVGQKTGKHEVTVLCILLPFQEQQRARAKRRLCFTAAVFHHLRAIKIQRALRAHWALESAKRQIHSVVTIQVQGPARPQSHFLQTKPVIEKHFGCLQRILLNGCPALGPQRWVRVRQQRRRYLEDRRKVLVAQRAAKCWLRRRHRAAAVVQRAVRKFLVVRRQQRVQQGIVKAQVQPSGGIWYKLLLFFYSYGITDVYFLLAKTQNCLQTSPILRET